MHRTLIAVALIAVAGCAATTPSTLEASITDRPRAPVGHAPDDPMFQFAGTWEGTLNGFNAPNFIDGAGFPMTFRLVIGTDDSVAVFHLKDNGDWDEMKHEFFQLIRWGSQAVVSSITSGHDDDGTWVEGSTFCLVHHDRDSLVAYWLRTVNNLDMPPTAEYYHFAWGNSGQMHRVTSP